MPTAVHWMRAVPFGVVGTVCIVAGGVIAAVTASSPAETVVWSVAYLVLVAGVAQVGLGAGQALVAKRPLTRPMVATQLVLWNGGNAAVIGGTAAEQVLWVDVGGALLFVTLALAVPVVRGSAARPWLVVAFGSLISVLLVSIPVGLVLARVG